MSEPEKHVHGNAESFTICSCLFSASCLCLSEKPRLVHSLWSIRRIARKIPRHSPNNLKNKKRDSGNSTANKKHESLSPKGEFLNYSARCSNKTQISCANVIYFTLCSKTKASWLPVLSQQKACKTDLLHSI